jgi:GTP-binding protein Era
LKEQARVGPLSGSVALVGRPNAGKSTLMNRFLAEKVAIVSDKPQTTRQRITGILSGSRGQMVFFDTPGVHKPEYRLNRRMVQAATDALDAADVVCLVVDASVRPGKGDDYLVDLVRRSRRPALLALNKIDLVRKDRLLPLMERYAAAGCFEEIVPVSAATGDGASLLLDLLWARLPEGPPRYDPELVTIHTERFLVAERIREKALELLHDELPFATAVILDRWEERENGVLALAATILVEKPGQKKIVIGRGGAQIKAIGIAARQDLERYLERPIYLDLFVREQRHWREDPNVLEELDAGVVAVDTLLEPR